MIIASLSTTTDTNGNIILKIEGIPNNKDMSHNYVEDIGSDMVLVNSKLFELLVYLFKNGIDDKMYRIIKK